MPMTDAEIAGRLVELLRQGGTEMAEDEYLQPVAYYTEAAVLAAERAMLFRRVPLVVAASAELVEPGAFRTVDIDGLSVVLVRQANGSVRGFHNVCRHRGNRVVNEDSGSRPSFRCNYHSWVYGNDGALRHVPTPEGFPNLDRGCAGLAELTVTERHGLVWVGPLSGETVDLDAFLGDAGPLLERLRLGKGGLFRREQFSLRTNWKLVIDTFLEPYHIRHLHRDTIGRAAESMAVSEALGRHGRLYVPKRRWHELDPDERDFEGDLNMVLRLWPNTIVLWVHDHAELYVSMPDGDDPNRCLVNQYLMTPHPDDMHAAPEKWERFWALAVSTTRVEDFAAAETMQRNFYSGVQAHVTFGRNEPGLHDFHRCLKEALS
jgi:phenylpropionate dioxygenase-like ring-hydroxylating dioxygenase large terminal subunit